MVRTITHDQINATIAELLPDTISWDTRHRTDFLHDPRGTVMLQEWLTDHGWIIELHEKRTDNKYPLRLRSPQGFDRQSTRNEFWLVGDSGKEAIALAFLRAHNIDIS